MTDFNWNMIDAYMKMTFVDGHNFVTEIIIISQLPRLICLTRTIDMLKGHVSHCCWGLVATSYVSYLKNNDVVVRKKTVK